MFPNTTHVKIVSDLEKGSSHRHRKLERGDTKQVIMFKPCIKCLPVEAKKSDGNICYGQNDGQTE